MRQLELRNLSLEAAEMNIRARDSLRRLYFELCTSPPQAPTLAEEKFALFCKALPRLICEDFVVKDSRTLFRQAAMIEAKERKREEVEQLLAEGKITSGEAESVIVGEAVLEDGKVIKRRRRSSVMTRRSVMSGTRRASRLSTVRGQGSGRGKKGPISHTLSFEGFVRLLHLVRAMFGPQRHLA